MVAPVVASVVCREGGCVVKNFTDMILYFVIAATMQNLVITTGFGASSLARMLRRPRQRSLYARLLFAFTVATAAVFYPIDSVLPAEWYFRMLRPLLIVVVTAVLYIGTVALAHRRFPDWYRRVRRFLPLSAFNNIVIGVALVINHQVQLGFFPAIGLAAGSALGFSIISAMSAEALERMDNPDTPMAFRGLPGTLVYLGLLALALMGFAPVLHLT